MAGHEVPAGFLAEVLSQPQYKLTQDWTKKTVVLWYNEYKCTRCGILFTEATNLGSWGCTQHAYYGRTDITSPYWNHPPAGSKWPCCGQTVKSNPLFERGCVRADHTDHPTGGIQCAHTTCLIPYPIGPWKPEHSVAVEKAVFDQLKKLQGRAVITEEQFLSDQLRSKLPYVGHSEEGVTQSLSDQRRQHATKILSKNNRYHQIYIRRFDLATELEKSACL